MDWQDDPPTQPGWYWVGLSSDLCFIVRVWEYEGELGFGGAEPDNPFNTIDYDPGWMWAGPIPKPEGTQVPLYRRNRSGKVVQAVQIPDEARTLEDINRLKPLKEVMDDKWDLFMENGNIYVGHPGLPTSEMVGAGVFLVRPIGSNNSYKWREHNFHSEHTRIV